MKGVPDADAVEQYHVFGVLDGEVVDVLVGGDVGFDVCDFVCPGVSELVDGVGVDDNPLGCQGGVDPDGAQHHADGVPQSPVCSDHQDVPRPFGFVRHVRPQKVECELFGAPDEGGNAHVLEFEHGGSVGGPVDVGFVRLRLCLHVEWQVFVVHGDFRVVDGASRHEGPNDFAVLFLAVEGRYFSEEWHVHACFEFGPAGGHPSPPLQCEKGLCGGAGHGSPGFGGDFDHGSGGVPGNGNEFFPGDVAVFVEGECLFAFEGDVLGFGTVGVAEGVDERPGTGPDALDDQVLVVVDGVEGALCGSFPNALCGDGTDTLPGRDFRLFQQLECLRPHCGRCLGDPGLHQVWSRVPWQECDPVLLGEPVQGHGQVEDFVAPFGTFDFHGVKPVVAVFELYQGVPVPGGPVPVRGDVFQAFHEPALDVPGLRGLDGGVDEPFPARHGTKVHLLRGESLQVGVPDEPSGFGGVAPVRVAGHGSVGPVFLDAVPKDVLLPDAPLYLCDVDFAAFGTGVDHGVELVVFGDLCHGGGPYDVPGFVEPCVDAWFVHVGGLLERLGDFFLAEVFQGAGPFEVVDADGEAAYVQVPAGELFQFPDEINGDLWTAVVEEHVHQGPGGAAQVLFAKPSGQDGACFYFDPAGVPYVGHDEAQYPQSGVRWFDGALRDLEGVRLVESIPGEQVGTQHGVLDDPNDRSGGLWRHDLVLDAHDFGGFRLCLDGLWHVYVHFVPVKVRVVGGGAGGVEPECVVGQHPDRVAHDGHFVQAGLPVEENEVAVLE